MAVTAIDLLVVLGPTATGKTRLGVELARRSGGEIISADSRQVYRGLDIGTGKDLEEYGLGGERVPYHLIDVVDIDVEYSVFDFQQDCYRVLRDLSDRRVPRLLVGGSGLYLEAVLDGYRLVPVPEDAVLRAELEECSDEELENRLRELRPALHDDTDIETHQRLVRAIEIATHTLSGEAPEPPELRPLVLGVRWPREVIRSRIRDRLRQRLEEGLIEEVEDLIRRGVGPDRLDSLGLEYRYVGQFLERGIANRNDLYQKLASAICAFAKRQETWFRRMESRGTAIRWIDEGDVDVAVATIRAHGGFGDIGGA
jgi:tRNA dimethylallyltransferase